MRETTYAKRAIVVKRVHLLIDGGTLGHQKETLITTAFVQDIHRFQRHLLQTGEIEGRGRSPAGIVGEMAQVILIHVAIEPDGEMRATEDAQRLAAVSEFEQRRLV